MKDIQDGLNLIGVDCKNIIKDYVNDLILTEKFNKVLKELNKTYHYITYNKTKSIMIKKQYNMKLYKIYSINQYDKVYLTISSFDNRGLYDISFINDSSLITRKINNNRLALLYDEYYEPMRYTYYLDDTYNQTHNIYDFVVNNVNLI